MGTDNLHHKKKKSQREKLNCKMKSFVYIVSEGKGTEIKYFKKIRDFFSLSNLKIKSPSDGNTPSKVFDAAKAWIEENKREGVFHEKDKYYCVFDTDQHNDLKCALDKVKEQIKNGEQIQSIISVPCFEYWLLLHLEKRAPSREKIKWQEEIIDSFKESFDKKYQVKLTNNKLYKPFMDRLTEELVKTAIKNANEYKNEIYNNLGIDTSQELTAADKIKIAQGNYPYTEVVKIIEKLIEPKTLSEKCNGNSCTSSKPR